AGEWQTDRRRLLCMGLLSLASGGFTARLLAATQSAPESSAWVPIENFSPAGASLGVLRVAKVVKTDAEWRAQLSEIAYKVTRQQGTEPAYSGKYAADHADGLYRCICCDTA